MEGESSTAQMATPVLSPTPRSEGGMAQPSSSVQEDVEIFKRKMEINLAGDQLRQRLHNAKLIKERRRQMSIYPNCFVAKELIDWLIERKEAPDRETAISIMQKFMDSDIIHHACNEHVVFKDAKLYYRFRGDDGTLSFNEQMKMATRSQRIYEGIVTQEDSFLKVREVGSVQYRRTFLGYEMLDWLMKYGEVRSRSNGEQLCGKMMKFGILQPVNGKHLFSDSDLLYQFSINFQRKRKPIEVLNDPSTMENRSESPDSPFCLRKLSAELPRTGFVCADDPPPQPVVKRSSLRGIGIGYHYSPVNKPVMSIPSACVAFVVLRRPVTVEELLNPGELYISKSLTIVASAVGWGFVARGTGPCHIQAVDPVGPAAAAGMKIRQFIKTANGLDCLRLDYQAIYKHILNGPRTLILEVLEPTDQ